MTTPPTPSDTPTNTPNTHSTTASATASGLRRNDPSGQTRVECVGRSPLPSGTDALSEPHTTASEPTASLRRWTPNHDTTRAAWEAVTTNLHERAALGLWGSRSIAVTIARQHGLTAKRAEDLIASAVRHGYLEERPVGTSGGRQVRLVRRDGV